MSVGKRTGMFPHLWAIRSEGSPYALPPTDWSSGAHHNLNARRPPLASHPETAWPTPLAGRGRTGSWANRGQRIW